MAQLTTPTPKKQNDRASRSFGASPKIDLKQLDLADVGVDSPELILNRARYQAVRENAMAQQTEMTVNQNASKQASLSLPNNSRTVVEQPEEDATDSFDAELNDPSANNTPGGISPSQSNGAKIEEEKSSDKKEDASEKNKDKDKDEKKGKEDSVKKEDGKDASKEGAQNNKPDSQGGGSEKKDPGAKSEALPASETPKKSSGTPSQEGGDSKSAKLGQAKVEALKNLKDAQDKLQSGDLNGAAEAGIKAGSKAASSWLLTVMWGAVWLDWTLLTLLGLNVYLAVSLFTDKIASFGEDYFFGKWMPKELAKWFEIILLALLDMIVLSIIFMILYGGYKFYTASFWDTFFGAVKGVTSGEGAGVGATKQILKP